MEKPEREFFDMPKFIPEQYPVVEDFACVEIYIPNDPEYLFLLQGLVASATKYWNYSGKGDDRKVRSNLWQEAYNLTDWGQCMECEDVADCIENNEAVQAAIAAAIASSLTIQEALNNQWNSQLSGEEIPGWYKAKNAYGGNPDCDLDLAWGNIRTGLVDRSFQRTIDVLELIEANTDNQEMLAQFLNAIPVIGAVFDVIPATDWLLWFDNVRNWMKEQFEAGDTLDLRDQIACDLFCIYQINCTLSHEQIHDYYFEKASSLIPSFENAFTSLFELAKALAGASSSFGTDVVYALMGAQYGFISYINDWFGVHVDGSMGDLGFGEPSDDWIAACDDCPTYWEQVYDFTIDEQGWTDLAGGNPNYVPANGWEHAPSPNVGRLQIKLALMAAIAVYEAILEYTSPTITGDVQTSTLYQAPPYTAVEAQPYTATVTFTTEFTSDLVAIDTAASTSPLTDPIPGYLFKITLRGTGTPPPGP